jgi:ABC-type bacteriocin/lantibiotic exporter with double-glycine peptidase domain
MNVGSQQRAHAVSLFLSQLGTRLHPQRVLELSRGEVTRRFIVRLLRGHGQPVRCVEVQRGDLAQLRLPTLLELNSGELCILERLENQYAILRRADEAVVRQPLAPLTARLGSAFERCSPLHPGVSFVRALASLLLEQRAELARLGLTVLALVGLGLLTPWLTQRAMTQALGDRSVSLLATIVGALLLAALMRAWLTWLRSRASITAEARLLRVSGPYVFERSIRLPFAEQQKRGLAQQLSCLGSAELTGRAVSALVIAPWLELSSSLLYLAALALAAPRVGVALALAGLLAVAVSYALTRWRVAIEARTVGASAEARARLHELIQGVATIKSQHAELPAMLRWLDSLLTERGLSLAREFCDGWHQLWSLLIEHAARLGVLTYASLMVLEQQMSVPDLVYLTMLCEGYLAALAGICRVLGVAIAAAEHGKRVDFPEPRQAPRLGSAVAVADRSPQASDVAVRLSDVWFRHGPDQPWILEGTDLTVRLGEHFTLRGPSGSGKSTILRLIAGLYQPERGTVSVLGKDPFRDRSGVRYLPQHAQLFAASLRDNLEQLSGVDLPRIVAAAQSTGLSDWLSGLPMGLDTVIAAQGANLSGGQRQWLLLTAAVASERPLVLMDEAMSQMDHLIRSRLSVEKLFSGKTTVRVTHDL